MSKLIFGVALVLVGAMGLVWWHQALTESGMDGNRNIIQYYIPYLLFIIVSGLGLFLVAKGYKDRIKIKKEM